jgi:hypothetical protein
MDKVDAEESTGIVQRMMNNLMGTVATSGLAGSTARTAISDVHANAYLWLRDDTIGPPLNDAFIQSRLAGATVPNIGIVYRALMAEQPRSLGAILMVNAGIDLCLVTAGEIVAGMDFVSRQDVEMMKEAIQAPFQDAIEVAADDMDQVMFQSLTGLYSAITNHLVSTARPLPRLITYQFGRVMTTLTIAQWLYADPSRADEIRQENKIVHPAFCPFYGVALSA